MSLTTDYRPQVWEQVIGQDHVIQALQKSVVSKKLHNAYLFVGLMGTGKTTVARILAKALNCSAVVDGVPCDSCESCMAIIKGTSLDVKELDMASNRGIDDVRVIQDIVQYAPTGGKWRIIILDEAHQMTPQAASALLKILEEPPQNVLWILCTTEVHKILPTIRSRCQVYSFKKVPDDLITDRLIQIAGHEINSEETLTEEDEGVGENIKLVCQQIAKDSGGSVRDAESKLSNILSGREMTLEAYKRMFGAGGKESFSKFLSMIANKDKAAILRELDRILEEITEPEKWASDFAGYLFDLAANQKGDATFYLECVKCAEEYLRFIYQNQPVIFLKSMLLKMASLEVEAPRDLDKYAVSMNITVGLADIWDLARWLRAQSVLIEENSVSIFDGEIWVGVIRTDTDVCAGEVQAYTTLAHIPDIIKLSQDADKNELVEKGLFSLV